MFLAGVLVFMSVSCTDATEIIKGLDSNPDLNEEARIGLTETVKAATEGTCSWDANVI